MADIAAALLLQFAPTLVGQGVRAFGSAKMNQVLEAIDADPNAADLRRFLRSAGEQKLQRAIIKRFPGADRRLVFAGAQFGSGLLRDELRARFQTRKKAATKEASRFQREGRGRRVRLKRSRVGTKVGLADVPDLSSFKKKKKKQKQKQKQKA
jgi:hypothetical protein